MSDKIQYSVTAREEVMRSEGRRLKNAWGCGLGEDSKKGEGQVANGEWQGLLAVRGRMQLRE
jgi:hypothetical protein